MADDLDLPKAVVNRIIKRQIPEHISVAKDAKLAFAKAAKVFIQYLTASASDFCKSCNRTNIGPNHVYGALDELGFKEFKDALEKALAEYKSTHAKKATKKKGADDKKEKKEGEEDDEGDDAGDIDEDDTAAKGNTDVDM